MRLIDFAIILGNHGRGVNWLDQSTIGSLAELDGRGASATAIVFTKDVRQTIRNMQLAASSGPDSEGYHLQNEASPTFGGVVKTCYQLLGLT